MTDQEKTRVTEVIFSSDELGEQDASVVVFDPHREPLTQTRPDHERPTVTVPDTGPGAEPTVIRPHTAVVPAPRAAAPVVVQSGSSVTPIIATAPSVSFARRHLAGLTVLERKLLVGGALVVVAIMLLAYLLGFALGLG